jgi:rhodanese-related sulfurtransferase
VNTPLTGSVTHVPVAQVADLVAAGAALIDVREHHETAAGRAPLAVCMPMQSFNLDALPAGVPLVFICRSGSRSDAVATALAGMGFTTFNVIGGMMAWDAAGLPVVAEDGEAGIVM